MPLMELKNICRIYGNGENAVHALKNVSLTVQRGEFAAIVGASGSGKSTLMNTLGCLDKQNSGEYFLNGKNVSELSESELAAIRNRDIGFIFQNFSLIPGLTALENVELPLVYGGTRKNIRRRIAIHALEKVSLQNKMNSFPSEMSGGQQQRTAIARALAADPSMILADEPTGSLDSKNSSEIMRILYDLNSQGKTIIMITHDNSLAAQAARIIRLSDGKIISDSKTV